MKIEFEKNDRIDITQHVTLTKNGELKTRSFNCNVLSSTIEKGRKLYHITLADVDAQLVFRSALGLNETETLDFLNFCMSEKDNLKNNESVSISVKTIENGSPVFEINGQLLTAIDAIKEFHLGKNTAVSL